MAMEDVAASADATAAPVDAGPGMDGAAGKPASPEEQAMYDKLVANAFNVIYDQKTLPIILRALQQDDPIQALAQPAVVVISRVLTSADQNKTKFSGNVILHAAKEIVEDLAELSREAGIHDYTNDMDALEGAFFRVMDEIRVMAQHNGSLSPEAAQQDLQRLQEMDESGELERLFMSLAEKDEQGSSDQMDESAPPPRRGLMAAAQQQEGRV